MRALVVLCLAAGVAHADDREEARREFTAGQASDRQREYQAAIEHYLRANDLVPHPNAMFNIAQDYERIGKLREAAVWYRRYLDAAQDSPDRTKVERMLAALAKKPGSLTVRSTPEGARVTIDDKFSGVTPYSAIVVGGPHRVTVEQDAMREVREVSVDYGEPAVVDVALHAAPAPGTGMVPAPLGQPPVPNPDRPRLGSLLGAGGGAGLRGEGAVALVDFGYAFYTLDVGVRFGKTAGLTAIDVVGRWAILKTRFSPYVGIGYTVLIDNSMSDPTTASTSSRGYTVIAGIKYDILRNDKATTSIVIESGVRGNGASDPGYVVPLMASVQLSGFTAQSAR